MGVQMTVKNGKWWHMASGLEVIGVALFLIVTVPAIYQIVKAEIDDMQYEDEQHVQQQELIIELLGKVDRLEAERVSE